MTTGEAIIGFIPGQSDCNLHLFDAGRISLVQFLSHSTERMADSRRDYCNPFAIEWVIDACGRRGCFSRNFF